MTEVRGRVWRAGEPPEGFTFSGISDCLADKDTLVWADIYDPDHEALAGAGRGTQPEHLGGRGRDGADASAPRPPSTARTRSSPSTRFELLDARGDDTHLDAGQAPHLGVRAAARTDHRALAAGRRPVRHGRGLSAFRRARRPAVRRRRAGARAARRRGGRPLRRRAVPRRRHRVNRGRPVRRRGPEARVCSARTFRYRKDLVELRRVVLPMREVVSAIQSRRLDAKTSPELDPLYADLYDHVLRASEWTESLRDMVTTVFETNLCLQDARLNTVMKKLTGWAAIIAVPTAITGFYGQNVTTPASRPSAGSSPAPCDPAAGRRAVRRCSSGGTGCSATQH